MTNRNDYQREYMRRRREANPPSAKGRMRKALRQIADGLADSQTEKGKRIHAIAMEGLGDE